MTTIVATKAIIAAGCPSKYPESKPSNIDNALRFLINAGKPVRLAVVPIAFDR